MVLADCEESLLELMNAGQNNMRRRWVATVSLLRAVGHVLDKVDAETSPLARSVIDKKYREPRPSIFEDFIEDERNNVLKQYRFSVRGDGAIGIPTSNERVRPAVPGMPPGAIGMMTHQLGTEIRTYRFTIAPFDKGPFAGRDPIDVVREALTFWHEYLDDVDRRISTANGPTAPTKAITPP